MKKNHIGDSCALFLTPNERIFKIMKLFFCFLVACISTAFADEAYSQSAKVNVKVIQGNAKEVLKQIESQTDYLFVYNAGKVNLDKKVSINVTGETVARVLDRVFGESDVNYVLQGKNILLTTKKIEKEADAQAVRQAGKVVVKGRVVDANGEPLIGASVVEQGTTNGVITDIDGKFTLQVASDKSKVEVSYVGYLTQVLKVLAGKTLSVALKEDSQALDEVVVVGYGTQKKVNLTGAVSMATSKDLQNKAITNALEGLQGVIPNFNINYSGGSPSSTPDLNIRGYESINGGSPLVVIDGVQSDSYMLARLNPEDIESISVLKDASSAAIYGSNASFGVVLVTTKQGGKSDKLKINLTSNFILTKPTILPKITDSYTHAITVNEALRKAGDSPRFSDEHVELMRKYYEDPENNPIDLRTEDGDYYFWGTIDYVDECLKKTSSRWRNNLNISGGTKITDYYLSAGYTKDQGFLKYSNENVDIYNIKAKVNSNITKWWSIGLNTEFVKDKQSYPHSYNTNSWWDKIYGQRTYFNIINPMNGYYTNNPVWYLKEGGRDEYEETNHILTFDTKVTPLKGWNIYAKYTYREYDVNRKSVARTMTCSDNFGYRFPAASLYNVFTPSYVNEKNVLSKRNIIDVYTDYEQTIGDHNFKVLLGFNQDEYFRRSFYAEREDMLNEALPNINLTTGEDYVGADAYEWATRGMFYRLNYSFKNRYLFETNARYDGSSRFPKKSRFGFFPSVSLGWRISEEPFMAWSRGLLDNLKFRVSYGSLGNQDVSTYAYIASMSSGKVSYLLGDDKPMGVYPQGLVAGDLTWETVNTLNFGVDATLLKNRLNVSFDIYERKTLDMLTSGDAMPGILGISAPEQNSADLSTKGWELSINWQDKIGDFSYGVGFVLSDSRTKITKYNNPTKSFAKSWYEGEEIGTIWGYETEGFIDTQEKLDKVNNEKTQKFFYAGTWKMGDIMYKDQNGDGEVNRGDYTLADHGDLVKLGNNQAHYNFGINLNASWKNLSVSAFFQGVGKRDYMPSGWLFWPMTDTWRNVQPHQLDTWSEDNRDAYFPQLEGRASRNFQTQSKYIQNAAYMRLKNLSLSYTLPKEWLKKTFIEDVRLTLSGRNLFEISSIIEPFDPENPSGMINPFKREYGLGINVVF